MVISKDGKRKRKDLPAMESSPEMPKRTKVQAQRKFAQGQSAPSASYSSVISSSSTAVNASSQPGTPIRENRDPPPELITHKRPRTEDFLTFLCFRGTSVLPSHLDFLNQNKSSTKKDETDTNNEDGETSVNATKPKASTSKEKEIVSVVEKEKTTSEDKTQKQQDIIPFAVRKRADQVAEGNRKVPKIKEKGKKEEINRRSLRTRGKTDTNDNPSENPKEDVVQETQEEKSPENASKVKRNKRKITAKELKKNAIKESKTITENKKEVESYPAPKNTSENEEERKTPSEKTKPTKSKGKSRLASSPPLIPSPKPGGRMTRQRAFFEPVKPPSKVCEEHSVEELKKPEQNVEFSSDDEQPLAKAIKLTKRPGRSPKKSTKARKKNDKNLSGIVSEVKQTSRSPSVSTQKRNVSRSSKISEQSMEKQQEKSPDRLSEKPVKILKKTKKSELENRAESMSRKSDTSSKVSVNKQAKKNVTNKKPKTTKANVASIEKESISSSPKRKLIKPSPDPNFSQKSQSQTDLSENENRTTRPTRKTKEAATIYMELIGQKLSLDDFDDDDNSIDSFPELPNAKKTQKMENELKQNLVKPKQQKTKVDKKKINNKAAKNDNAKGIDTVNITSRSSVVKHKDTSVDEKLSTNTKQLEKNFSDSDDEPLATKVNKPNELDEKVNKEQQPFSIPNKIDSKKETELPKAKLEGNRQPFPVINDSIRTTNEKEIAKPGSGGNNEIEKTEKIQKTKLKSPSPSRQSITKQSPKIDNLPKSTLSTPSTSATAFPVLDRYPSPKVNPTFLTPKFDRNLAERRVIPETASSTKTNLPTSSPSPAKIDVPTPKPSSPSTTTAKKFDSIDNILAANLMPSKEESGKIFGIASVSLAQSSGPDNTKCTLGKCGSIHKPVLGPVVPTEAYLGEQLSSKERRKAKVNMTHEQIQKWLIECSSNPDEIQDDLDDDFDYPLKPMTFPPSPPPFRDEKESTSHSSSSKTTKDNVKSESAWSGKGPSLKATPIIKEETRTTSSLNETIKAETPVDSPKPQKQTDQKAKDSIDNSLSETPTSKTQAQQSKKETTAENVKSPKPSTSSTASPPKHQKGPINSQKQQKSTTSPQQKQKSSTPISPKKTPAIVEQKQKPQPAKNAKRQPVYNTKMSEPASKKKAPANNSFAAFSAENETSVYSFDKEDDVPPPVAKPFRRHSRRESHYEDNPQAEKIGTKVSTENETSDKKANVSKDVQQNSISVTLSPEENSKLVKVSLDDVENPLKAVNSSEKGQNSEFALGDSDSEGHTFYIPLQGIGPTGSAGGKSGLIQGVAVKLGREGPEGPNQSVIMHATLVTKSHQMISNPTPIPESMNVHEIVKNLLSSNNKESPSSTTAAGSKSVPIGTVQPRFKSTAGEAVPGSNLTRVNSNSSLFSGSNKSRATSAGPKKMKDVTPIKMCNNTAFPRHDDPSQMVEAPIFRPTEKEFLDPIEFIERITPVAARFGICKIIPPASFKPECRVSDDMRFTAYNQYVHKMLHRWGPSAKELSAIKKYLATQSIAMTHPPWIGGMEIDLPRLYHTVQELGGLKEVIEKKKWARVAEEMCIPKLAQDRVTKLDDIYCKYLLPYDTLSPAERQKLFDEVEADWAKREARARRNADRCVNPESVSNEDDGASSEDEEESEEELDGVSMECIVKGRSMPLNQFFRIARNTMAVWFKNTEPTVADIEAEFWRHVAVRDSHVCVHSGSIDSSGWGYGFPTPGPKAKGSTCAKHPWNLKVLTNNQGSVLRSLGPVMGVTVPTLHVGMLFSACCWYRDPHGLSWIEYLHTGASKIWYGIPDDQSSNFRAALTALIPTHCQNKTIWLPCDTVMVPPHMLTDRGVSLCRTEQKPGEFVVIFPRAYTSSMATGYVVSESVYFATSNWLLYAKDDFKDIHDSCEPAMFSLEQLLFAIASDQRVSTDILTQILPMMQEVYEKEVAARQQLKAAGVTSTEKLEQNVPQTGKSKQKAQHIREEHECDLCRANLYISMVKTDEGNVYCLQHALKNINNGNVPPKQCKLIFTYNIEDIENLIKKLKDRLIQKKPTSGGGGNSSSKKSK